MLLVSVAAHEIAGVSRKMEWNRGRNQHDRAAGKNFISIKFSGGRRRGSVKGGFWKDRPISRLADARQKIVAMCRESTAKVVKSSKALLE